MRTIGRMTLVSGLALVLSSGARADDAANARAMIAKAIKATGGAEKLAKWQSATWKEKGIYYGMGQGVDYTGDYAVAWPSKFRMEIKDVFTMIVNGDKGWTKMGGDVTDMTKEQVKEHNENHYCGWVTTLVPLKDKAFTFSLLGEIKIGNHNATGVKVSQKGHRDVNLFFDKENGLLIKAEYPVKPDDQPDKEVTQAVKYHQYKDIEGTKVPTKVVVNRDGKKFVEAEMEDMKPADKLDDSLFAKP